MATHGVYTFEQPTELIAPIESESAIQVAIGTAPVNIMKNPSVNEPILTNSYPEAVEKL